MTSPRSAKIVTTDGLAIRDISIVAGLSESRVRVLESETPAKVAAERQVWLHQGPAAGGV